MYKLILNIHVISGLVAILSGFMALFAKKGLWVHRKAGFVFFVTMSITGAGAAYLGYYAPIKDMGDVLGGLMTVYLVTTAWMTVKRKEGQIGYFEYGAFLTACLGAASGFLINYKTVQNEADVHRQLASIIFTGFIVIAALLDLRVILVKGLYGAQRMARHVWRMCMGMFIAAGSFFLGQMQVFPEWMQRIEIVSIPVIILLLTMIYWLARVWFTGLYRKKFKKTIPHSKLNR